MNAAASLRLRFPGEGTRLVPPELLGGLNEVTYGEQEGAP